MISFNDAQASFCSDDTFFAEFSSLVRSLNLNVAANLLGFYRLHIIERLVSEEENEIKAQIDVCERILIRARRAVLIGETSKIIDFNFERSLRAVGAKAGESAKKGKSAECEKGEITLSDNSPQSQHLQAVAPVDQTRSPLVSSLPSNTPSIYSVIPFSKTPTYNTPSPSIPTLKEHIENSRRGVSASSFGSKEVSRLRAKRASVSPFDRSLPANSPERNVTAEKSIQALPNPFSRSWGHTSSDDHFLTAFTYANKVQHDDQNVLSFRLTFSDERTQMLLNDPKPATRAARWIRNAFEAAYGRDLPYAFKFEVSDTGQLHMHGFVIVPVEGLHNDSKRVMQRVLLQASGEVSKSSNSSSVAFYDGLRYYSYLRKAERATRRILPHGTLTYLSGDLKRQVKHYHAEMRGECMPDEYNVGFICSLDYRFASGSRRKTGKPPAQSESEAVGGRQHESVIGRIAG